LVEKTTFPENRGIETAEKLRLSKIELDRRETRQVGSWDPGLSGKIIYFSFIQLERVYEPKQEYAQISRFEKRTFWALQGTWRGCLENIPFWGLQRAWRVPWVLKKLLRFGPSRGLGGPSRPLPEKKEPTVKNINPTVLHNTGNLAVYRGKLDY
jgi:hypothetical protein